MNEQTRTGTITINETYRMVDGRCMMESSLNPGKWLEVPVFISHLLNPQVREWKQRIRPDQARIEPSKQELT